mgnify:FL=1|jgi:Na+/melibiose symporter-like transporter
MLLGANQVTSGQVGPNSALAFFALHCYFTSLLASYIIGMQKTSVRFYGKASVGLSFQFFLNEITKPLIIMLYSTYRATLDVDIKETIFDKRGLQTHRRPNDKLRKLIRGCCKTRPFIILILMSACYEIMQSFFRPTDAFQSFRNCRYSPKITFTLLFT